MDNQDQDKKTLEKLKKDLPKDLNLKDVSHQCVPSTRPKEMNPDIQISLWHYALDGGSVSYAGNQNQLLLTKRELWLNILQELNQDLDVAAPDIYVLLGLFGNMKVLVLNVGLLG